jgi:hypothetical protein
VAELPFRGPGDALADDEPSGRSYFWLQGTALRTCSLVHQEILSIVAIYRLHHPHE